jgi:hypothetical protein
MQAAQGQVAPQAGGDVATEAMNAAAAGTGRPSSHANLEGRKARTRAERAPAGQARSRRPGLSRGGRGRLNGWPHGCSAPPTASASPTTCAALRSTSPLGDVDTNALMHMEGQRWLVGLLFARVKAGTTIMRQLLARTRLQAICRPARRRRAAARRQPEDRADPALQHAGRRALAGYACATTPTCHRPPRGRERTRPAQPGRTAAKEEA